MHRCSMPGRCDLRIEGGQATHRLMSSTPAPREIGRRSVYLSLLSRYLVERFLLNCHKCGGGDQHPILVAKQGDLAIGMTGYMDPAPAREVRRAAIRR